MEILLRCFYFIDHFNIQLCLKSMQRRHPRFYTKDSLSVPFRNCNPNFFFPFTSVLVKPVKASTIGIVVTGAIEMMMTMPAIA